MMGLVVLLSIMVVCMIMIIIYLHKTVTNGHHQIEIWKKIVEIDDQWIMYLQKGKRITQYFEANDIRKVCFLGFNDFVYLLFKEINGETDVICVEDRYCVGMSPIPGLKMTSYNDFLLEIKNIDLIVDVFGFDRNTNMSPYRKRLMQESCNAPVVDIFDLVHYLE